MIEKKINKNNISDIRDCFGCGVCAASCPRNIIHIGLNENGFYEPFIHDETACVHCGICLDVCSFSQEGLAVSSAHPLKCWAAWSNDEQIRRKCSSGGIGFEIGKQLIEQGYKAVGCRYDIENQRAEHYIATTVEEFVQSIGSKYIQSYTVDAFKQVERKGQKYLITGTPCQIDSFRRMIHRFHCEEKFVLLDFYCHCVPSMYAWKAYLKMLEPKIGKITYASWRNKFEYGWHDSWLMSLDGEKTSRPVNWHDSYNMLIRGKKGFVQSRLSKGDLFYKLFLGDVCLGLQCQNQCKYKYDRSSADIRIGDLWGRSYAHDEKGVSALVAFTERGKEIIESLNDVTLVPHPFEIVAEGQMRKNARRRELSPVVMALLKRGWPLQGLAFRAVFTLQKFISRAKRIPSKIKEVARI